MKLAQPNIWPAARQPIWLVGALCGGVLAIFVAAGFVLATLNGYALTELSFTLSEPLAALVGLTAKNFLISYSYEVKQSNQALGNTHEIVLGIALLDYLNNKAHLPKPYFL